MQNQNCRSFALIANFKYKDCESMNPRQSIKIQEFQKVPRRREFHVNWHAFLNVREQTFFLLALYIHIRVKKHRDLRNARKLSSARELKSGGN